MLSLTRVLRVAGHRYIRRACSTFGFDPAADGLHIRAAEIDDINGINRCNRASLPENYGDSFFKGYIKTWPRLALVATDKNDVVIGYVLGRVGDVEDPMYILSENGFLTSVAVLPGYRSFGIGGRLIKELHSTMAASPHWLSTVSLHVREENEKAIKLYKQLGYVVELKLPKHYPDGGTAFLMTKKLSSRSIPHVVQ